MTYQTNELSAGECKRGRNKHAAETAEAVGEGAGLVPQTRAKVLVVAAARGPAAEDKDEGDDHEDDDGSELEDRRPELLFCVSEGAKDVDDDDGAEEDADPYRCSPQTPSALPSNLRRLQGVDLPTLISGFQYPTVIAHTVSSNGNTTAHCMT